MEQLKYDISKGKEKIQQNQQCTETNDNIISQKGKKPPVLLFAALNNNKSSGDPTHNRNIFSILSNLLPACQWNWQYTVNKSLLLYPVMVEATTLTKTT